jgi:glyoxylate/hydroxypyruvate reductase A
MTMLLACDSEDAGEWRRTLAELAPEIDFRATPDIGDGGDVEMLVCDPLPDALMERLPNLRCVTFLGHGASSILGNPRLPAGVPVTRLKDAGIIRSMTELALLFVLGHHWHAAGYARQQRETLWEDLPSPDTPGTRVGVLGLGAIGENTARTLAALGFAVSGWARSPHEIDGVACTHGADALRPFLAGLDIVVCVLPETAATRDLFDANTFAAMKPGAYFINVGRGSLVDEDALVAALDSGRLSGAALDVFRAEPLPPESPLWRHPGVIVTPHIGGGSMMGAIPDVVENYRRMRAGEPLLNLADRALGY